MRTDTTSSNAFVAFVQADGAAGDTSGYSLGITGSTGDFRLTKNAYTINDSTESRIFVDGTSGNIGFGTDSPRGKLEVTGNVVIGHRLTFSGVLNDEFGNSFISERLYDADNGISELLIFKGTDSTSAAGPDRIRHIAADHLFQVYSTNTPVSGSLIDSAIRNGTNLDRAMLIGNNGKIFMGTSNPAREATLAAGTTLFINGGLEFGETQKLKFGKMDVFTSGGLVNVFEALDTSPISFKQNNVEYLRFTHEGLVGFGTSSPTSNVHIYSNPSGDADVLKLQNPGTNSKVGLTLTTDDTYGGYVRGFSDSTHSVHGTVIGAVSGGTEGDGIHVIHTSNVGIGTVNPSEHFTVYNGVSRMQHATSNAMMQFATTTPGNELAVSNIYGDVSGNVYVDPFSNEMIINSNLEVTGDLNIDGKIDLGNQVAIGLGGVEATTDLQIGGGLITGSSNVACKRYSQTFELGSIKAKMVRLLFDHSSFYARIVCMLRKRDNKSVDGTTVTVGEPTNRDQSIMILEVQGGTHDGSTSASDETITVGTKNLFGGDSDYPWNPSIVVGKKGIIIKPANVESNREYSYDIHVELMTSRGGKLKTMRNNVTDAAVDSDTGELIQTFDY
jgi:hypothetical protein